MRRNIIKTIGCLAATLALCLGAARDARAITVAQLQKELAKGEKVTLIDVRSTGLFSRGHIPGAINIPASLCPAKKLPPLGKVIVYDEGLGRRTIENASAALAAKPGLSVEVLSGGFAAWESASALTTRGRGMKPYIPNYITYGQLKAANPGEITLVDLRQAPTPQALALKDTGNPANQPLTDLAKEFPGMKQTPFAFGSGSSLQALKSSSEAPALLVLVDNGDGTAEAAARSLRRSGYKRHAILLGGEKMIVRHGQPGLERTTLTTLSMKGTNTPSATVTK